MSLSMSPSLTLSQRHRQVQRLSLTLAQRSEIKSQQTLLQIELVATLREENYTPKARCPRCGRDLAANEILAGFRDDVNDFTTQCTECQHRFEPKLVCFGTGFSMEIPFYCDVQAQSRLSQRAHLPPSEIAREYPGEYRSAVIRRLRRAHNIGRYTKQKVLREIRN